MAKMLHPVSSAYSAVKFRLPGDLVMAAPNPLRRKSRRKQLLRVGVILIVLGAAVGWFHIRPRPVEPGDLASYKSADRGALLVSPDPFGDAAERVTYLDQGWEPRDRVDFYTHP